MQLLYNLYTNEKKRETMKKLSLSILSAILFLSPLSAFEWGGLADNTSTEKIVNSETTPSSFTQSNGIYLWCSSPLNEDGSFYIKAEAMYKYNFYTSSNTFIHIADLDLFKISKTTSIRNSTLNISGGRFSVSDISGAIFNQNCDGLLLDYSLPTFDFSAYIGHTGLLNKRAVTMLSEKGYHAASSDDSQFYAPALSSASYVPISITAAFPSLFLNQSLTIQGNAFFDCTGNSYNRMYGTISLSGPLAPKVFYNLVSDFGTINFKNFMNYSKATVSLFAGKAYISAGAEYATENFRGFSTHIAYSTGKSDEETKGLFMPVVSANISFTRTNILAVTAKAVFTSENSKLSPTGAQADITDIYNILSDVQLMASISGFKGFSGATTDLDKLSATIKLAISF